MAINRALAVQLRRHPHLLGHFLGYTKLLPLHSEWIQYCWESKTDVVLMAHRNSYKTTAVDVVGTIWWLLFHPNDRVLILRKEYDGATSIVKEIKAHYESEKLCSLYSLIYAKQIESLRGENWRDDSLTLLTRTSHHKEGSVEAIGIGGAITGRHYEKVMADDIVTDKDRVSKAERENTKNFVRELKNIPVPGGTRTFTGTLWHREDAFSILPEAKKYPVGTTNIPGFTEEYIKDLRASTTVSLYAANYLLELIADEDRIFGEPSYRQWDHSIRPRSWLDPAYSGDNTTALCMIGEHENVHIMTGWVWRKDVTDMASEIVRLLTLYKCGSCFVETNADQGSTVRGALGDLLRLGYAGAAGRRERQNKHIKIVQFLKPVWSKIFLADNCQVAFLNQIMDYREGEEPDDAPDAAASLVRELGIGRKTDLMRRFG